MEIIWRVKRSYLLLLERYRGGIRISPRRRRRRDLLRLAQSVRPRLNYDAFAAEGTAVSPG